MKRGEIMRKWITCYFFSVLFLVVRQVASEANWLIICVFAADAECESVRWAWLSVWECSGVRLIYNTYKKVCFLMDNVIIVVSVD